MGRTVKTLLKATNENWGLTRVGDWKRTEFVLSHNGILHIKVYFLHPVVDVSIEVSSVDIAVIRENLKEIIANPVDATPSALDGVAWSFEGYNDTGKQIFTWKLSYIYGISSLENIGKILNSYIPEYERPEYTEYEIERYITGIDATGLRADL